MSLRHLRWMAAGVAALLVASAAALPGASKAPAKGGTKLPVPACRITYKTTGTMASGTMLLAWTADAQKFRYEMKGIAGPEKKPLAIWSVYDGTALTFGAKGQKQAMRIKGPKEQTAGMAPGLKQMLGAANQAQAKGKVVGKETILGKPCEIRQINRTRVSLWSGVPLRVKSRNEKGQTVEAVATKVEAFPKFAAGYFKAPAGYQIMDFDPSKMMAPPGGKGSPRP